MSTDFTGDPADASAPDAAPTPENFPIVRSPSDGDILNAASVLQRAKALANHVAFLKKPIARVSQWAENLRTYRDGRGRRRFKIDHFGMDHGALYGWAEQWFPSQPFTMSGPDTSTAAGNWLVNLENSNTLIESQNPGVANPFNKSDISRALQLVLDGTGAGNKGWLRFAYPTSLFNTNALARLTLDFAPLNVTGTDWRLGFMMSSQAIDAITRGVFFKRPDAGGANWHCITVDGGAPTDTDSGVAGTADVAHVFEIYLVGSAVGDDSTNRALFFIDGDLKANHTTALPLTASTNTASPMFGGVTTGGGAAATRALIGQIKYSQITQVATL
jgi:hypothetical protein